VGVVSESPVKEKLYRGLERLEEKMIPAGAPTILNVVFIKQDGSRRIMGHLLALGIGLR
jgi:hypothetical protein